MLDNFTAQNSKYMRLIIWSFIGEKKNTDDYREWNSSQKSSSQRYIKASRRPTSNCWYQQLAETSWSPGHHSDDTADARGARDIKHFDAHRVGLALSSLVLSDRLISLRSRSGSAPLAPLSAPSSRLLRQVMQYRRMNVGCSLQKIHPSLSPFSPPV